jgi:hypothetical protein
MFKVRKHTPVSMIGRNGKAKNSVAIFMQLCRSTSKYRVQDGGKLFQSEQRNVGELDFVWDLSLQTVLAFTFVTGEIFATALLITFLI